jgi:hypothetical protein
MQEPTLMLAKLLDVVRSGRLARDSRDARNPAVSGSYRFETPRSQLLRNQ